MQIEQNKMERQTQIIDLTDYTKEQILERVQQILDSGFIQKFTLLVKRQVHQSKTQKKLQKKENAIQKIKHRYSASSNINLFVQKDHNIHKLRPSGDCSPALKISSTYVRTPDKKFSKISSIRSRQPSKMNQSLYNINSRIQQLPKSLQLYYEGQYQLALIQFFDEEKQIKRKIMEITQNKDTERYDKYLEEYVRLMINIGNCYFCQKQYQKAMKYYNKSSDDQILKNVKLNYQTDEKLIGQKYNNLGSCYAHKKQYQQSLKCFNQALKIYAKYPELDCSNLLKNIGVIYFRSGMYSSAETYFSQSIQERKIKSPQNQESLLISYYKLGLCQKYIEKFQQSTNNLLFALNISSKGYALHDQILKQLAKIYQIQQKYSQALVYYQKLSDDYERKQQCQGEIYENVAKIHRNIGNFTEHDKFIKLAIAQYRRFNNQRKMSELSNPKYEN